MLQTLLLAYPQIDPVALSIGPVVIRWYALAYVTGILAGWWYIAWLNDDGRRQPPAMPKQALDDVVSWTVLSVLIGGRLGYVLFYKPDYYFANPLEIFEIWKGGMSFHGGLAGVLIGFALFCRHHKLYYLPVMDLLACATPIGLGLGRIANFINGELYGRVDADAKYAMVFPEGGPLPRHPSQLYEAALEGLVLFLLLFLLAKFTHARRRDGLLGGIFLAGYAIARMSVEPFREPDAHLGILSLGMTMGQWLSVPVLLAGLALVVRALLRKPQAVPHAPD